MKLNLTFKIWVLIIFLILSLISIFGIPPSFSEKGVLITSVEPNSMAFEQGLRENQIIISIDGNKIESIDDFTEIIKNKFPSETAVRTTIILKNSEVILFSNKTPEITVSDIPKTRIKLGLDLIGGSRALVQAEGRELTAEEVRDLVAITENRLNEFGLTDLKVRQMSDLGGNHYMLVEIAGATPKDLENLISQQGKFEAKIGNETVFIGGERDIASVCRGDPTCAYIEICEQSGDGYFCNFRFEIILSENAAKRHAEITQNIGVNVTPQGRYLEETLDLYLDDNLIDSLLISEGLKGRVITQIVISGSGSGSTRDEAYKNSEEEMHKLQTLLITGSLPFKLEIVKLDTISPT